MLKLKEKIEAERGKDYATENQKLIYAGKVLMKTKPEHNLEIEWFDVNSHFVLLWNLYDELTPTLFLPLSLALSFAGLILVDDRTIASYNFDEKKFIVVMVNKSAKKEASSSESTSTSSAATAKKDESADPKSTPTKE